MPRYALAAAVLLAIVAGVSYFLSTKIEAPAEAPASSSTPVPAEPTPVEPMRNKATPPLNPAALSSPEETLQTQVRLLFSSNVDRFRETLMPGAQREVTRDAFYGCIGRLRQSPLSPVPLEGETIVDGHPVRKVRVMGSVDVSFHRIDGKWLAETLWCKPAGAPGPTSEPAPR